MKISEHSGNLLNSDAQVIIHQVNCQGVMGSGVARAIREKWPVVFTKYSELCSSTPYSNTLLGFILSIPVSREQVVVNMFSQDRFGYNGERFTSYDALDKCLNSTREYCSQNNYKTLALPWHMSCDRGGACWEVVLEMIKDCFKDTDIEIEIWKL